MKTNKKTLSVVLSTTICFGALPLSGCDKAADSSAGAASNASASGPAGASSNIPDASAQPTSAPPVAPQQVAAAPQSGEQSYVPPTAEQLYQMVAPIALFPDKLVALVLAGSTYPDEVTAADGWLAQNRALRAAQLQDAAN